MTVYKIKKKELVKIGTGTEVTDRVITGNKQKQYEK